MLLVYETMCDSALIVCLLFLCSALPSAFTSHFLGGNIMVRPTLRGVQSEIQITFHISWFQGIYIDHYCDSTTIASGNLVVGEDSLQCLYGCQNTSTISNMSYVCIGYGSEHHWSYGERHLTHNFSVANIVNKITIGTTGCCWVIESKNWNISTTFSMMPRPDTGQINSSPRVLGFSYLHIPEGYRYSIPLAVHDPDNDRTQCRWAIGLECADICDSFAGAVLDPVSCTIRYHANNDTGSKVVAIVVEDFLPNSSQPLSSVSHQFIVKIAAASESCSPPIPMFVAPTPPHGTCITIPPEGNFIIQVVATSGRSYVPVTGIDVIGPIGTRRGQLQHIRGTNNYFINITWTLTVNQQNDTHLLCYVAVSQQMYTSEQSCIKLVAGYHPPTPLLETATPNDELVYPSNNVLQIKFDQRIQRPLTSAFIRFYNSVGEEVYHIDVSSSLEVTYSITSLTISPRFTFTERSAYYVNFDGGVAQSIGGCQLMSTPIVSRTFWTFEVRSLTPVFTSNVTMVAVNNPAIGQPLILQCSVTTIRDINSRVDFVWISNGIELRRVEGVGAQSRVNNSAYTDHYLISQLSTSDNNSLYTCEVMINKTQLISAITSFTLIVLGNSSLGNSSLESEVKDDITCNDDNGDSSNPFVVLFAIFVGLNLVLIAVVTYLTWLVIKQKRKKASYTEYKKSHEIRKGHIYDLPSLQESVVNPGYIIQARKEEKSQKENAKSDDGKVKLEEDPTYHCVSYNKL